MLMLPGLPPRARRMVPLLVHLAAQLKASDFRRSFEGSFQHAATSALQPYWQELPPGGLAWVQ